MTWTDQGWAAFCAVMRRGWPGEFTQEDADAYRAFLGELDPDAVAETLRRLLLSGQRFRPSVSELLAAARRDPSQPTFDEMLQLVFFARGAVLRAEPTQRTWGSPAEGKRLRDAAALERAETMHPLVASFVARQTPQRLRELALDDPEWGEVRRKELRQAWEQHTEACEGRDVAALAAGSDGGLRKFDPLAALTPPQIPQEVES